MKRRKRWYDEKEGCWKWGSKATARRAAQSRNWRTQRGPATGTVLWLLILAAAVWVWILEARCLWE